MFIAGLGTRHPKAGSPLYSPFQVNTSSSMLTAKESALCEVKDLAQIISISGTPPLVGVTPKPILYQVNWVLEYYYIFVYSVELSPSGLN